MKYFAARSNDLWKFICIFMTHYFVTSPSFLSDLICDPNTTASAAFYEALLTPPTRIPSSSVKNVIFHVAEPSHNLRCWRWAKNRCGRFVSFNTLSIHISSRRGGMEKVFPITSRRLEPRRDGGRLDLM